MWKKRPAGPTEQLQQLLLHTNDEQPTATTAAGTDQSFSEQGTFDYLAVCSKETLAVQLWLNCTHFTVSETPQKKGQQAFHDYSIANFVASWLEWLQMISNDSK